MCASIDMGNSEELSMQMLYEQQKAAEEAKRQAQAAKSATPKTMRSNEISSTDAAIERTHGVQSTYLASRLDGAKRGGNNLGE